MVILKLNDMQMYVYLKKNRVTKFIIVIIELRKNQSV